MKIHSIVVLLLLSSACLSAITIQTDVQDSDYAYGNGKGTMTDKYRVVRSNFFQATDYVSSVFDIPTGVPAPTGGDSFMNYYVSPQSARSIAARQLTGDLFVHLDVFQDSNDTKTLSFGVPLQNRTNGRVTACRLAVNLNGLDLSSYTSNYTLFTGLIGSLYDCMFMNSDAYNRFIDSKDAALPTSLSLARSKIFSTLEFDGTKRDFLTLDQGIVPTPNTSIGTYLRTTYLSTVPGVLMENDGKDKGVRFENSIYYADVSASSLTQPNLLTRLAPSLAVASGFYAINTLARFQFNPFPATKTIRKDFSFDPDFNFQSKQCLSDTAIGYCATEGELSCSNDGMYKLKCVKDPVGGNCLIKVASDHCYLNKLADKSAWEMYGANSRCFMVSIASKAQPSCMSVIQATSATNIIFIEGLVTNQAIRCDGEGVTKQLPVSTTVTVTCPGQAAFVTGFSSATKCPNDCNGNGI